MKKLLSIGLLLSISVFSAHAMGPRLQNRTIMQQNAALDRAVASARLAQQQAQQPFMAQPYAAAIRKANVPVYRVGPPQISPAIAKQVREKQAQLREAERARRLARQAQAVARVRYAKQARLLRQPLR